MFAGSFAVTLELEGPVVSHSTASGAFGIDAVMAKTRVSKDKECYYLAGSLIKGLVGEAWQELGHDDWRQSHFGEGSQHGAFLPQRGKAHFEDFLDLKTDVGSTRTQYRIQIDAATGSVQLGHFQVIEAPWKAGEKVQFEGKVRLLAQSREAAAEIRARVERGLHWIMAAGAERTAGFGKVCGATCGKLHQEQSETAISERFGLELRLQHPFCLATRRISENLFQSDHTISGGAIKGAIAEMASVNKPRYAKLLAELHAIRILHAFPGKEGSGRVERRPLSLVHYKDKDQDFVEDVAEIRDAVLRGENFAPAFDIDWKDDVAKRIHAHFHWEIPDTELRVRTQIEGEERRAKDENLFAYEMTVPHDFVWKGAISLEAVEEKEAVRRELADLLSAGVFGIGKTKAWGQVTTGSYPVGGYRERPDGKLVVTLQSPALLCDPSRHLARDGQRGVATEKAMEAEYKDVWKELAGEGLELVNFFHRVSLAGGTYFYRRFQDGQEGKNYRPFLLTDAGSVFVFKVHDKGLARRLAEEWLQKGLDIPPGARDFYGLANDHWSRWWKKCPYVRENGYGEVSINGAIHENGAVALPGKEASHV